MASEHLDMADSFSAIYINKTRVFTRVFLCLSERLHASHTLSHTLAEMMQLCFITMMSKLCLYSDQFFPFSRRSFRGQQLWLSELVIHMLLTDI